MAQGALSSSPFTNTCIYDVFLSFRGEDTRYGFTGNLYSALSQRGVFTFIDDNGLKKGEEITPSLSTTIQKSRMAIVIFSKNYASSTFCLDELVQILDCYTKGRMWIWPVFYDVDPSEVRHQRGNYGEELAKYEQGRFKDDKQKLQKWRSALRQASDFSGWHFKHGGEYEHQFIGRIIEEVSGKLKRPFLHIADYPVGLETRIHDVLSLIGDKCNNDVHMLGIHGTGGMGKSTLARAIYNLIADRFEGSCFLANVREKSTKHGLEHIQETMLSELVGERNIKLGDVNQGIPILKQRLHSKKVLLILDDVDKKKQLEATAGRFGWFGYGSVVIITTRNKHLLDIHGVEKLYEVKKFNDIEALELFRWNALKNKEVGPSYSNTIMRVINYANGLPLALETISSNLFGKTLDERESALEAYLSIPDKNIQEILRVSYDGLEETEKEIFLDIACFFNGCTLGYVTNMLKGRGFEAEYGISVLEGKSLIKILRPFKYDDYVVTMHSLIEYMGRELVRQQSTKIEKRTRLWFHENVIRVLEKNQENDEIEAMMLDMLGDEEVQWNEGAFGKMTSLGMLIIKNGCLSGSPKHLPNSLRVLEWWGYPATSLPSRFHSRNLVILNLSHSSFRWDTPLKESKVLRHLIFTGCKNIRQIPNVSGFPNLTELCVDDCTNLIAIDDSVGFLHNLQRFSAKGCTKLSILPHRIMFPCLEYLCLRNCNSIDTFTEIVGHAMKNLPRSIKNLKGIQKLNLNRCNMLENDALSNIFQMFSKFLFLGSFLLIDSNMTILPARIEECRRLDSLNLDGSKKFREIRGLPRSATIFIENNFPSLETGHSTFNTLLQRPAINQTGLCCYFFPGQSIPEWFDVSSTGGSTRFWFRNGFPCLLVCAIVGFEVDIRLPLCFEYRVYLEVNGIRKRYPYNFLPTINTDHISLFKYFFDQRAFNSVNISLDNGWNYGEILFVSLGQRNPGSYPTGKIKSIGVYIDKTMTRMEDIQFTCPYPPDVLQSKVSWRPLGTRPVFCDGTIFEEVVEESSRPPVCVMNQSLISSSDQVRLELDLGTSSTMLQTTDDASLRNQTELTQDDDVEMEAFYASLDAETRVVSSPHDKLAITAPSEEAKEAFKIVQDFISNDASVLLHPEQCSVMKISLEYLSNLSEDDGISTEMRTLVSEASREFTYWSRDYTEASMTIEYTTSELHRADDLEAGLEANKHQFMEALTLEDELLQKLARLEKRKNDLEEQINVIKADISVSESEKKIAYQRKRNIFQEGKILKDQRDELEKKAPRLQQEHGLAKEKQTRIQADWSKLQEKFKNIAVE